jgi:acetate kinase
MRDIEEAIQEFNDRAQLAHAMYCYRIRKYIGAYAAAMNGVDAIVFTGGIGERGPMQRKAICSELTYLGVDFDETLNDFKAEERPITREGSKVQVWVIPTNEELMIARETLELVKK